MTQTTEPPTQKRKRSFSSFSIDEALEQLHIEELQPWQIEAELVQPSDFFRQRLERLQCFDLERNEISKSLLIDAICEEGLQGFPHLKFWKGAYLEGETVCGMADYLLTQRRASFKAPFVCVVEAKKDDFEQGLAQCLVEMQACQWNNQKVGSEIDVFGIVTNGGIWQFYQLTVAGAVLRTPLYAQNQLETIAALRHIFERCDRYVRERSQI